MVIGKITPNFADLGFDQFKTFTLKSRGTIFNTNQ